MRELNNRIKRDEIDSAEAFEILKGTLKGTIKGYRRKRTRRSYDEVLSVNQQIEELQARGIISQDDVDRLQMTYITGMTKRERVEEYELNGSASFLRHQDSSCRYGLIRALVTIEGRE